MEFTFFKRKIGFKFRSLEHEGFTKVGRFIYVSHEEIGGMNGPFYEKYPLKNVYKCVIARRVRRYNLHIYCQYAGNGLTSIASLDDVKETAEKIANAVKQNCQTDVPVEVASTDPDITEVFYLPDWDIDFSIIGILYAFIIWPLMAIVYYLFCPIINIFLKIFVK